MYIKVTNGVPESYTIRQLRLDNPNVSFPKDMPESVLADFDVFPLLSAPQPEYNGLTQRVVEGTPELTDGSWYQTWVIEDLAPEEVEIRRQGLRITPRQARLHLSRLGLLTDIETFLQGQGDAEALIEWEYATAVERGSAWVTAVQAQMSWTDEQLDQMFIDASEI